MKRLFRIEIDIGLQKVQSVVGRQERVQVDILEILIPF